MASVGLTACSDDSGDNNGNGDPVRLDAGSDTEDLDAGDVAPDTTPDPDGGPDGDDAGDVGPDPDTTPDPDAGPDADPDAGEEECNEQTSGDADYDGLLDCEEEDLGTDIRDTDTDNDGLNDLDEVLNGTDPTNPDTDGDGVPDGQEVDLGLDPRSTDSYGDGTNDGDRWIVVACDSQANPDAAPEPITLSNNQVGNWKLALPSQFSNYTELSIPGGDISNRKAAAVYDDPANEVAGALISAQPSGGMGNPVRVVSSHRGKINTLGNIDQEYNSGENTTWDFRKWAVGRYLVSTSPMSTRELRDQLLFAVAPFNSSEASGLPAASGADYTSFRVFVSAIYRTYDSGEKQILTSLAIAPADKYDSRDKVKFRMDDLTNTTNIAEASDDYADRCSRFEPKETAQADFYWMLDQSGSMGDDYNRVKSVANQFYNELNRTGLDYRLGVANMDDATDGKLRSAGWHTDLTTFISEIDAIVNWSGNTYEEYGLQEARQGLEYMLGLGPATPPSNMRIRPDAQLITIFMSDELAQSLKDAGPSSSAGQQLLNDYVNFFQQHTTAFSIVGDGQGCGEDAQGYKAVAQGSQGSFASLCAQDISETIRDIIFAATGQASNYVLPETPVSSSLRVYLNGQWVPRSRESGFDYFAATNSIAFFGDRYRPELPDGTGPADHIAVSYEAFQDRTKDQAPRQ